jgi:hypothetical protein
LEGFVTTKPFKAKVSIDDLKGLGFSDVMQEPPRRIIMSLSGREKVGKTYFALTAPGPIFIFNIDLGTEGVVDKFQKQGKKVYVYDVRVPKGEKQVVYQSLYNDFRSRVEKVYTHNEGTLIMDTSTEAFELARLAHFGKLTQVLPHHYTEVNSEWREFMRLAYDSTMNTILIHKVKPKYVNNARTSEYELAGFGEMGYLVQLNATCFREKNDRGGAEFCVNIDDCRQNMTLAGLTLRGPMVDVGMLIDMVHG